MSVLPRVSGREVVAALAKLGYEKDRQKGSHIVLRQVSYPPGDRTFLTTLALYSTQHQPFLCRLDPSTFSPPAPAFYGLQRMDDLVG